MKAHKRGCYTQTEARREVEREAEEHYAEIFCKCAADLTAQITATIIWTLMKNEGWGEVRIRRLIEHIHDTEYLMDNPSRLHHRFSPLECETEIKERFGIDLREEFPVKVEVKP